MYTPQAGIFALGTSSHAYLEFDLLDARRCKEFASKISAIREPRTTTGGVNFVIGFRPELWRDIAQSDAAALMTLSSTWPARLSMISRV
jgi:putative iron-dependent peroxidase